MRLKRNKRGQQTLSMPFGLIFSLFLIAIFFVVAFIVIKSFIGGATTADTARFYEDLQDKVDDARSSQSYNSEFEINLPSEIDYVCFANLSRPAKGNSVSKEAYEQIKHWEYYDSNVFLIPPQSGSKFGHKKINYLNVSKIVEDKNPYCFPTSEKITIEKGFYDKLVSVS